VRYVRKAQAAAVISRNYTGDVGGGYADSGLGARPIRNIDPDQVFEIQLATLTA
jgi:hypothetical protein